MNKQHYVFLDVGDMIQEGDEAYIDGQWIIADDCIGESLKSTGCQFRRPVYATQIVGTPNPVCNAAAWDAFALAYLEKINTDKHGFTDIDKYCAEFANYMMKRRPKEVV